MLTGFLLVKIVLNTLLDTNMMNYYYYIQIELCIMLPKIVAYSKCFDDTIYVFF